MLQLRECKLANIIEKIAGVNRVDKQRMEEQVGEVGVKRRFRRKLMRS